MRSYYIVTYFILATHFISANLGKIKVNPQSSRFIDKFGREAYFHGTNVVQKSYPWYPPATSEAQIPYNHELFSLLKEWGLNFVRLGAMWPGIEPSRGYFNQTYIGIIDYLIQEAGIYGIYTMVDMHQDGFNRKLCVEGFPDWSVQAKQSLLKFPLPLDKPYQYDSQGLPSAQDCARHSWATYYFSKATGDNFQNLYNNYDNLTDQMAQSWYELAIGIKDSDNLIGYEMYNEPWVGDIYSKPWMLIPSMADRYNIQPLYQKLAAKLRQADNDTIIFFESITFDNFVPNGFSQVPGGESYSNRSAISYHYYEPPDFWSNSFWRAREADSKRLKSGVLLSEFSIYQGPDMMNKVMDLCDEYMHSWASWEIHSLVNQKLEPNYQVLRHVSRTYAQAIAGHGISQSFNSTNSHYTLVFTVDTSITQVGTQIYYNQKLHYPHGFKLSYEPDGGLLWSILDQNLIIIRPKQGTQSGQEFTLKIEPIFGYQ